LLVSVRNAAEAEAALSGGATLIDVKEPRRGALGRAADATIAAVVRSVAGRSLVSAALGELMEGESLPGVAGLAFVKWGLAGAQVDWRQRLAAQAAQLEGSKAVAVAYADWERAAAPRPEAVATFAIEADCGAFLLDTWKKDGRTLLDWLPIERIAVLCHECRAEGVPVALAGSLNAAHIETLRPLAPTWFAVRGAVCVAGRETAVHSERVRRLARCLQQWGEPGA
jgi:uncharacterized protein (UPF0264 family)